MATGGGDLPQDLMQVSQEDASENEAAEPCTPQDQCLDVGTATEDELYATMKKKDIVDLVKVFKFVIEEYVDYKGEETAEEPTPSRHAEPVSNIKRYLTCISGALDFALRFLENPDNGKLRQHEGALRGLLKLVEVGSVVVTFGVLFLASELLAVGKEDYRHEIEFIEDALDKAQDHQKKIGNYVEQASRYLTEIINDASFSSLKARHFDSCIREAQLEIQLCENRLKDASELLQTTLWRLQGRRWLFVGIKWACLGCACYSIFKLYRDEVIGRPMAALTSCVTLIGGMPFCLPQADKVYNELRQLQMTLRKLDIDLKNLIFKLESIIRSMCATRQANSSSSASLIHRGPPRTL